MNLWNLVWRRSYPCDIREELRIINCNLDFGYKEIMATLEAHAATEAAALAAVKKFIGDVKTDVEGLATQIAELKAQVTGVLSPDQQALLDQADTDAKEVLASVTAADDTLTLTPTV